MRRLTVTLVSTLMLLIAVSTLNNAPGSKAQNQGPHCGLQTLKGSYGAIYSNGTVLVGPGSPYLFSAVGVATFDGNGNVTGTEHANANGTPFTASFEGTYEVNADCTGTITATFNPGNFEGHLYIVIVDNGKEAFVIQTDQGSIFTGTFKRQ